NAFLPFSFSVADRTQSKRSEDCISAHFVMCRALCQFSFATTSDALKCDFSPRMESQNEQNTRTEDCRS
ncbi:hypothetical protein P2O66_27575, partial [Escherichia coli]